jgi:hypothetical protein
MRKITTKTENIINLAKQKGDSGILDLMDYIYGKCIYDWLSNKIENLSDEDKDELLDELEFDIDKTVLYVDKTEFIEWYFDNFYDLGKKETLVTKLIEKEEIKLEDLMQSEYIPIYFIKNRKDIKKEDMKNFGEGTEILGKKYKLKWTE